MASFNGFNYLDMKIPVKVTYPIAKPVEQVFDAIINPNKINQYFTSHASSVLENGKKVMWEFADYGVELEIEVLKVIPNEYIAFNWKGCGKLTTVEMRFEQVNEGQCKLEITEDPFENTKDDLQKVMQQTIGWTDFICSLKAWLQAGINLRKC